MPGTVIDFILMLVD